MYVLKRPHMDHFMQHIGPKFEVVVFTASLSKYADPLLDLLDKSNVVRWRLFRSGPTANGVGQVHACLCRMLIPSG